MKYLLDSYRALIDLSIAPFAVQEEACGNLHVHAPVEQIFLRMLQPPAVSESAKRIGISIQDNSRISGQRLVVPFTTAMATTVSPASVELFLEALELA